MSEQPEVRTLGIEALRALAHPLRVQIFSALSSYGPATASTLAARLGESSGSTSYHLRQLERHGFVREDESRGNARDRWWERVPGAINVGNLASDQAPAVREASALIESELVSIEDALFAQFRRGQDGLPLDWQRAADSSSATLLLSSEQLESLSNDYQALVERYRAAASAGEVRRVGVQFRAFPVLDPPTTH